MYAHWDHLCDSIAQRYDLETASEDNDDGHVDGAVYVSGYMACLYLADLECRALKGAGAVTFDQNGEVTSISSENLREGLSAILSRLHQGDTLDEVINDVSGGAFVDTQDFTKRFIKGVYNEEKGDYEGESDFYRFVGENTLVVSTVPDEVEKDGGTSYSGRDSYEDALEAFRAREAQ